MAEEATGRTIKQLKQERTSAKIAFTKLANYLTRAIRHLTKSELQKEYSELSSIARDVSEKNDVYEFGLLAEIDGEEGEAKLHPTLQSDLTKTTEECHARLEEVRKSVQSKLWSRYAEGELTFTIKEAEAACEGAHAIPIAAVNKDGYELRLDGVKALVQDAVASHTDWERWIPEEEKESLDIKMKGLRTLKNLLEAKRADFLTAQRTAEEEMRKRVSEVPATLQSIQRPILKIKSISLPKFYGIKRNFHQWKKDWVSLQRQGEPTGSAEAKKFQLLDSVDEKISSDLRLSTYNTAEDMFRVLENRYGNKTTIALEIIDHLDKIPHLKSHQPRKVIDLIQNVEKALVDLTELGNIGAINNPLVIQSIEGKLPDDIKKDWLVFMVNPENGITPDNHFDKLLKFLKTQEDILEKLDQLGVHEKQEKQTAYPQRKYAWTQSMRKSSCVVCGDQGHSEKLFFCTQFKELKPKDKMDAVEELGACKRCLECHEEESQCKDTYLCRNWDCRNTADHHYLLCQRGDRKKTGTSRTHMLDTSKCNLTEEQEEFVSALSADMAEKFRRAFTKEEVDMAARTSRTHFARSMRATSVKYQELAEIQDKGQSGRWECGPHVHNTTRNEPKPQANQSGRSEPQQKTQPPNYKSPRGHQRCHCSISCRMDLAKRNSGVTSLGSRTRKSSGR